MGSRRVNRRDAGCVKAPRARADHRDSQGHDAPRPTGLPESTSPDRSPRGRTGAPESRSDDPGARVTPGSRTCGPEQVQGLERSSDAGARRPWPGTHRHFWHPARWALMTASEIGGHSPSTSAEIASCAAWHPMTVLAVRRIGRAAPVVGPVSGMGAYSFVSPRIRTESPPVDLHFPPVT